MAFTALAGAVWVITQIPLPSEAPLAQTTLIFDSSGRQVAELHGVENRFPVELEQVPLVTQAAVIAAEDRHFLAHRGLDPWGILRATWADIRHRGAQQGGSTITQQYVKNTFVGSERTLARKLKEAVISIKLERKFSKQEILERYLNTVYFGRGAYGVQAAAKTYFKKDVSELDLRESAYLAGLIRTPSSGDVYVDPDTAYYLRSSVLNNMVRDATISQEDADAVEGTRIESYVFRPEQADTTFTHPDNGSEYFIEYVRQQLVKNYGEDRVLRGGLRVYTTLDPKIQAVAYDTVYNEVLKQPDRDPSGALVSLDSEGRVVAMVGNRDWKESQVNVAVGRDGGGSGRQGGSAFKPFVLAEAINQGMPIDSKYYPGPAEIGPLPGWQDKVHNYNGAAYGSLNLIDATAYSVNTIYAQLVADVKPANVVRMAHDLGITSPLEPVPSITLGTQEVSVLEMANAYLTFYNNGMRVDPRVITKVTEGGTILVDDKPANRRRVIPREVAQQVKAVLGAVVAKGSGIAAALPNSDVWGKTGTTEAYGDAWFVGANEELVTAVWMGYPEGQSRPLYNVGGVAKVSGGTWPAVIFQKFMNIAAPGDGKSASLPPVDVQVLNESDRLRVSSAPEVPAPARSVEEEVPGSTTTTAVVQPTTTVTSAPPVSVTQPPAPPATSDPPTTDPPTVITAPTIPAATPTTPRRPTPTITFPSGVS